MCGVMVQTVQYTVWRFRSCSSSRLSTLPFDALAVPHGPVCSENHRDSSYLVVDVPVCRFATGAVVDRLFRLTVAAVDARPRCAGLQVPQVRSVRRQSRSHCCCFTPDSQYIDKVVDVPVVVRMPVVVQQQVP